MFLVSDVRPFLFPIGLGSSVLRLMLTSASTILSYLESSRLSGKPYSRVRIADLPGYKRELSPRKLVIYLGVCWERFRCPRATHLRVLSGPL